jgi:hypothetical protein
VILRIRIGALCKQRTRDLDEAGGSLRCVVVQAGVARVEQRLPVLNAARLARQSRILLQPCTHAISIAEHELGLHTRVRNAGMHGQ